MENSNIAEKDRRQKAKLPPGRLSIKPFPFPFSFHPWQRLDQQAPKLWDGRDAMRPLEQG